MFSYNGTNNTNYNLALSGTSLSSRIRNGSDNVNLKLYDSDGWNTTNYINPNRETVVVIHGWNNNSWTEGINRLTREVAEFGTQVLAATAHDSFIVQGWRIKSDSCGALRYRSKKVII